LAVLVLEVAGFRHQGITMHLVLVLLILMTAGFTAAWACRKGAQVFLLYSSCALALIAVEVVLRVKDPRTDNPWAPLFRFDRNLGWAFAPGAEVQWRTEGSIHSHVRINSAGFRDREYSEVPSDAPHSLIAILGDSFVANINVNEDEVFTNLMGQQLGPELAVRNFGIPGYGQVQEFVLLQQLLATQKPKLACVVLYIGNDFEDNLGDAGVRGYQRPRCRLDADGNVEVSGDLKESDRVGAHTSIHSLIAETRIHGLVTGAVKRFVSDTTASNRLPFQVRYCPSEWGELQTHAWRIMCALLTAMAHACDQYECEFAVVLAPTRWQADKQEWGRIIHGNHLNANEFDRAKPNEVIHSFCAEQGYLCLDLLPSLERYVNLGEQLYFETDEHWNARGQVRVAEALVTWIREWNGRVSPSFETASGPQ
jgi:hypothetical protein